MWLLHSSLGFQRPLGRRSIGLQTDATSHNRQYTHLKWDLTVLDCHDYSQLSYLHENVVSCE